MEAIVLAGGLGTRLKTVVGELPKAMAPVRQKPFLEYILNHLESQGTRRVVLAVGYRHELIRSHFGDQFQNLSLVYSVEEEPLGTGGALKKAMDCVDENHVAVVNGDTFFDVDMEKMKSTHQRKNSDLTMALKPLKNFDRYGCVEMDADGRIRGFMEKKHYDQGLINGGVYVVRHEFFDSLPMRDKFSLEKDVLEAWVSARRMYGVVCDSYFIDIGIPEDYRRAETEMAGH